jgi:hypothetical protein
MALFGFGDITFDRSNGERGPLGPLTANEFQKTTLKYPIDLGNTDKGHYLVIYIRKQKKTSFGDVGGQSISEGALDIATKVQQAASKAQIMGSISKAKDAINNAKAGFSSDITGKINSLSSQSGISNIFNKVAGGVVSGVNNLFGQPTITFGGNSAATEEQIQTSIRKITGAGNLNFLRTTVLTSDAIALYMPDTLVYSYSQNYDQLSLGGELGGQAAAAVKSAVEEYEKTGKATAAVGSALKSGVNVGAEKGLKALGSITGSQQTAQAILAATGRVENPMLEMVYKSPAFRDFQFDFTFYPRSEKEALEVQKIIGKLKFHQAPEILQGEGAQASGFLVPPSEFDIKFYYNGAQNPNIPTVGTCILKNIQVNYAPNGFSAYEIPGENGPAVGRTGMPVSIQMTLNFQEVVILTKSDFIENPNDKAKQDKKAAFAEKPLGNISDIISP